MIASAALQPAVTVPAGFLLLGLLGAGVGWAAVVTTLMALVPVAALVCLRVRGTITSLRLAGRLRVLVLAVVLAYELGVVVALDRAGAPLSLIQPLTAALTGLLALALTQPFRRVSVHTSVLAIFAGAAIGIAPVLAGALACLTVLAGWSRVVQGAHTPVDATVWPPAIGVLTALTTVAQSAL